MRDPVERGVPPLSTAQNGCDCGHGVRISVLVPCYNESATVLQVLREIQAALQPLAPFEVIVVDDASTDHSLNLLSCHRELFTTLVEHPRRQGKGRALASAIGHALGEVAIVQDADAEYCPEDLPRLLEPLLRDEADVVFGRRVSQAGSASHSICSAAGVRFFSWLARSFTGLPVHDIAACYKAFRTDLLRSLKTREKGFPWDAEVTMKLGRAGKVRFLELPIRYSPRTKAQGKKLRWRHGIRFLWVILKLGFFSSPRRAV